VLARSIQNYILCEARFVHQQHGQERLEMLHSAAGVINRLLLDIHNPMVVAQLEQQLITQRSSPSFAT
jgi:hypothetical protein